MTYQGARARSFDSQTGRVFEVSRIRLGMDGQISAVLWQEVNSASNLNVNAPVVAPVEEVVDAMHDGAAVAAVFFAANGHLPERSFRVIEHDDGKESIALVEPPTPGRELVDIATLDD